MTSEASPSLPLGSKLLSYIPSSDLLNQLLSIEPGLRQRRRLGRFGLYGGLAFWLLQLAAVGPSLFPSEVQEGGIPGAGMLWIPATALIGIYVWSTYWLKVSRQAFRYTCSVGGFRAARAADTADPCCLIEPKMGWLAYDLAQRLNRRVPRLFFSEIGVTEYPAELKGAPSINERHIHIDGSYVVRPRADEDWIDEIGRCESCLANHVADTGQFP